MLQKSSVHQLRLVVFFPLCTRVLKSSSQVVNYLGFQPSTVSPFLFFLEIPSWGYEIFLGLSPLPVRVTTRIITFLVGNPYKPSFPLLLGGGTTQDIPFFFLLGCYQLVVGFSAPCFFFQKNYARQVGVEIFLPKPTEP